MAPLNSKAGQVALRMDPIGNPRRNKNPLRNRRLRHQCPTSRESQLLLGRLTWLWGLQGLRVAQTALPRSGPLGRAVIHTGLEGFATGVRCPARVHARGQARPMRLSNRLCRAARVGREAESVERSVATGNRAYVERRIKKRLLGRAVTRLGFSLALR